ncbi:putative membrane protein YhhN [Sporosarcina luteola]|nr:putative membrane protein YhhN [Sporosarcina luteola]
MTMNLRNWALSLLLTSVVTTLIANLIGNHVSIAESIPGVLSLSAIAFVGIALGKLIPLKIPPIVYVVLTGMVVASPISPIAQPIIDSTAKISFMAPITIVGTLAGIGLDFKSFISQSWKMVIVAILVFTGTFLIQATFAEIFLNVTNAFD